MSTTAPGNGLARLRTLPLLYRQGTGQSLFLWVIVAMLQFLTQIVLHHELRRGEFGALNTALGVIGLMTVPLFAVLQAFTWYLARNHPADQSVRLDALRASSFLITETIVWAWAALSFISLFLILPLLSIWDFGVQICILLNIFALLGMVISSAIFEKAGRWKGWSALFLGYIVLRFLLSMGLAQWQPVAAAALGAFVLAAILPLIPVLRHIPAEGAARLQALRALFDRDLLLYLGAAFSVFLGVFLFINADRLIAQEWLGVPINNNVGYVNWTRFDAYQTAGLLARSLLWGTQPFLFVWFVQRSRLERTTTSSMTFFWIYLGALILGFFLLLFLQVPLSRLFCGDDYLETAGMVPSFALAMMPLGLLQALAFFALASRRFPECFLVGGCSLGYAALLYWVGEQAALLPAYMFGGGGVALMMVLFLGVVRWGRKQP